MVFVLVDEAAESFVGEHLGEDMVDGSAVVVVELSQESDLLGGGGVLDGDLLNGHGAGELAGALGAVVVDDVVGGEAEVIG